MRSACFFISVFVWSYKSQQIKVSDNIVSRLYFFPSKKVPSKGGRETPSDICFLYIHTPLLTYLYIYISCVCVYVYVCIKCVCVYVYAGCVQGSCSLQTRLGLKLCWRLFLKWCSRFAFIRLRCCAFSLGDSPYSLQVGFFYIYTL